MYQSVVLCTVHMYFVVYLVVMIYESVLKIS